MMLRTRLSRLAVALAAATLTAVLPLASFAPAAHADAPSFVKTLVGPSVAAMYPSGLEWDAIHDRIVVADTGLDRIDFYGLDGSKQGQFGVSGINVGEFSSPRDVALDGAGNIYVADAGNNRVEKFDSTGSTMAWAIGGTGSCNTCLNTPIGVTWDATNNVLLVASTGQSLIKAFNADGSFAWKSPTGTALGIASPRDVTRGPDGRIWISDYKHHQIAVFNVTASGTGWAPAFRLGDGLTAGHGDNELNFPYNVAFSPDGTIAYVADTGNDRIARWDISGASPVWLAPIGAKCSDPCPDNSPGLFEHLRRVTVTPDGTVIGADFWGSAIQVFQPDGTVIRQIEGAAAPVPGVAGAWGVAAGSDGTTYVVDRLNQRIERFDGSDNFLNTRGSRGTAAAHFSWPEAAAVAPDGSVWVADTRNDRLQHFAADLSGTPSVVGDTGATLGLFNYPEGLTVDSGGKVWVADTRNDRVQTYDPATKTFTAFGAAGSDPGQFDNPEAVAVTADAVYVADTNNDRVEKLSLTGAFIAQSSVALNLPEGLTVAPDGTVWVADTQNDRLVHLSSDLVDLGDGFGQLGTDNVSFDRPHSLAIRGSQLLVADTYNNRVQIFQLGSTPPPPVFNPLYSRQISDPGGVAPLYPAGGASDASGNLYLADSGGSRIVKLDPSNNVTPVFSTGLNDPRDVNLDSDGTLWLMDTSNSAVKHITTTGTLLNTFGSAATFKTPYGIAVDATGVYVADTYNMRVVKISKSDGSQLWSQTTCAGTAFLRPRDVGIGPDGQLYVADTDNNRIAVLDPATGNCLRSFGGTGTGNGKFKSPRAVTADPTGNGIWVADAFNYRIQHLSTTGTFLAATNGGFGEGTNQYRSAHCVFADNQGRIDVCDTFNYRLQRYTENASGAPVFDTVIGGTKPTNGGFNGAFDVTYGPAGEMYAIDWFNHRIEKFNPDGSFAFAFGGYGSGNGSLIFPRGITVSPDGQTVVVTDSENNRIDFFDSNGNFVKSVKPLTGTALNRPYQSALAPDGSLWVADTNNNRVLHLASDGTVLLTLTNNSTIKSPRGIALSSAGNVYVSNTTNNRVEEYSPTGTFLATIAAKGTGPNQVMQPHGLRIANVGGSEKLFIADNNNRIVVLSLTGSAITTFGTTGTGPGQFTTPNGVGVNPVTGEVAVADWANNRISIWTTTVETQQDTTPPDGEVSTPAPDQSFTLGPITMTGTATDNVGVVAVAVGIKDRTSGLWLQSNGTTWGTKFAPLPATLSNPNATATSWQFAWSPAATGDYAITLTTKDAAGNADPTKPYVNFTVAPAGPDTTPPTGKVTAPVKNGTVPVAPLTITGTANDNVGVKDVLISIQDRNSKLWWQGTAWGTKSVTFAATLANPNAPSTTWSYVWNVPSAGSYGVLVKVDDVNNNTIANKPWQPFTAS